MTRRHDVPRYGPRMATPQGWIAKPGEDQFAHTFGGSSWDVSDENNDLPKPALVMTLDLNDPRINLPKIDGLHLLPICSHINCDAWVKTQTYQINPDSRRLSLVSENDSFFQFDEMDRFPNPLPETRIVLAQMDREDYPINEEMYWTACDRFLGSSSFIRVLGPPVWLQWVDEPVCECGLSVEYICSIGYENYQHPGGIIPGKPFFIGEGALYFFLCPHCLKVVVTSQPS